MNTIKTFLLWVVVALPIVVVGILCVVFPNNQNVVEVGSTIWFVWEGIILLLWYIEWKRKKKSE